jgi:hypothetical protein
MQEKFHGPAILNFPVEMKIFIATAADPCKIKVLMESLSRNSGTYDFGIHPSTASGAEKAQTSRASSEPTSAGGIFRNAAKTMLSPQSRESAVKNARSDNPQAAQLGASHLLPSGSRERLLSGGSLVNLLVAGGSTPTGQGRPAMLSGTVAR